VNRAQRGRSLLVGLLVGTLVIGNTSFLPLAEAQPKSRTIAESLFQNGRVLMRSKKYAEACLKFEESQRLDPQIGTLLNLGVCHVQLGKIATAWGEFEEVRALAKREARTKHVQFAIREKNKIESRLPKIVIEVPDGSRVPGLQVVQNQTPLHEGAWATPLPIDPGDFTIEAKAAGYQTWRHKYSIKEKETLHIPIPKLEIDKEAVPPVHVTTPPTTTTTTQPPANPPPASEQQPTPQGLSTPQTIGLGLGAVGLISIGIGSYFGAQALNKRADSNDLCPTVGGQERCSVEGASLNNDAKTNAQIANWTIGLGLAAGVTGLVLFLTTKPKTNEKSASANRSLPLDFQISSKGGQAMWRTTWLVAIT
jgi:tetratricopeptide (TPR) repeat protein